MQTVQDQNCKDVWIHLISSFQYCIDAILYEYDISLMPYNHFAFEASFKFEATTKWPLQMYTLSPPALFCPENSVCFLRWLHIFKCTSDYI